MVYQKENVYENLIQEYEASIDSLKVRLAQASDINEIKKLTELVQAYEDQLTKLKQVI